METWRDALHIVVQVFFAVLVLVTLSTWFYSSGSSDAGRSLPDKVIARLTETAEPREETSFGSPPQGPEVALDLDPNRFAADASTDADG